MSVSVQVESAPLAAKPPVSFYSWLSLVFVLIALAGFARTYVIPVATAQFTGAAILHVHGLLFFAWTLLFALQTVFVGRRRVDLHRAAGMIGIIRDWKSRGRPHRAYVIGGIGMVLVHALRIPFSKTAPWHSIADGLLALAA